MTQKSKGPGPNAGKSGGNDPLAGLMLQGLQHHQAGRLSEAQTIYRQILSLDPRHPQSLHMMGMIGLQTGRYDMAEELVQLALAERKDIPSFYDTLGNILKEKGKFNEALAAYRQAVALKPDFLSCLNKIGAILFSQGRHEEAMDSFQRALVVDPKNFDALNNSGVILQEQKKYNEAIEYYKKALGLNSQDAALQNNMGLALSLLNKHDEAVVHFEKSIQIKPDYADAYLNLGQLYQSTGAFEDALQYFQKAVSLRPDGRAHAKMGLILQKQGKLKEASQKYEEALKFDPNSLEILNNLAAVYNEQQKYEQALVYYNKALAIEPEQDVIISNIANTLKNLGRLEEAIEYHKRAIALSPDNPRLYSNLLMAMVYAASVTPEEFAATSRTFGERVADPMRRQRPFLNDKNPERKLRVGYVSPDFNDHAVNYFFSVLLKQHDREKFEIYAYSNTAREDAITEQIKKEIDHWRDIRFINDEAAADLIETDRIDILVDLAGHTAGNKLMVFARKPAPVQVTWMGYAGTTGMQTIDYRISDPYAEPPGMTEHLNAETLWRLPEIFCCYQAHEKSPQVIDHPPFEDNGYITFGCFNNFTKVTDPVLDVWAEIMQQVPDSRLLLEIKGLEDAQFRKETEMRLRDKNLPMDRVILETRKKANQFVLYNRLDIALDPFPCAGGTTSMDTMWMGVPLVTLAGAHFVSRMGVTILTNAGLAELIAENKEDYIRLAVELAKDHARLKTMRYKLRDRVKASPLMDQKRFTRNMESAYRKMWQKFCEA